jgi:hypothetical protein
MKYGFADDKMLTGGVFWPAHKPLSMCDNLDIRFVKGSWEPRWYSGNVDITRLNDETL